MRWTRTALRLAALVRVISCMSVVAVTGLDASPVTHEKLAVQLPSERAKVARDEAQGHDDSFRAFISADGRYVAFESSVRQLRAGRMSSMHGVFVRDRRTGTTELGSIASDGGPARAPCVSAGISGDGRYVLYGSDGLFVRDRQANKTERVPGHGSALSANGRYVAFGRRADGVEAGGPLDLFVYDRQAGKTEQVSVGAAASAGLSVSADGRYVAFYSDGSNLVAGTRSGVFVHDRQTGKTEVVAGPWRPTAEWEWKGSASPSSSLSADGRYVAFVSAASDLVPGDTHGVSDVFVHDRQTGKTERASVASDGTGADEGTSVPHEGYPGSLSPTISADGRYIAFASYATDLVPGDTNGAPDIFVHDRRTEKTERVSVASDGTQANGGSSDWERPGLSADGRYVAFTSYASNLVAGDTNDKGDVFVHDRRTGKTERVSLFREESIVEAWHRDGFRSPLSLSVYSGDESCWVADSAAGQVVHLARTGKTVWSGGHFRAPCSVSVNSQDGSCYVADSQGKQVARLAADGSDMWRKEGFAAPSLVVVNHDDGSCWVIDAGALVHLSADGTELSRGPAVPAGAAVNQMDGSSWTSDWSDPERADRPAHEVHSALVHLSADGRQLWRLPAQGWYAGFEATAVNPVDGSCWVAWVERRHDVGQYDSKVIHFAVDGRKLWEATGFEPEMRLSVSPYDGSCWVTSGSRLVHLAADGRELSRAPAAGDEIVAPNLADNSVWVARPNSGMVLRLLVY